MTKECWLFLDCKTMTGYPPNKCPNYKNCKHNALNSVNRVCALPYERYLSTSAPYLYVYPLRSPEAQESGWFPAVRLPYLYESKKLEVGFYAPGIYEEVTKEAKQAGYEIAKEMPYYLTEKPKQLRVKQRVSHEQRSAGWHSPIDLPLCRKSKPSRWEVDFDDLKPEYKEAIAAGWMPAEPIWAGEFPL